MGKKGQPSYRIVVTEHTSPVKAKFVEILGYYNVSRTPRELVFDEARLGHWLSVGAQPSSTVASLLKGRGVKAMEQYLGSGKRKRKKTKGGDEAAAPAAQVTTAAPAAAPVEAPEAPKAEEPVPEVASEPTPEAPAEVAAEPAAEAAPAEPATEETPAA